jgi:hypothetical protein
MSDKKQDDSIEIRNAYREELQDNKVSLSGGGGTYRFLRSEKSINAQDLIIENATFTGLTNYVKSRKEWLKMLAGETMFRVNMREANVSLHVLEYGGSRHGDDPYMPSTTIHALAKHSDHYKEVKGFMKTHAAAHELAMALRECPYLFNSAEEYTAAVGAFRSMSHTISKVIADTSTDDGSRKKKLELAIDGSKDNIEWEWNVSVYEGGPKQLIKVKTMYEANDSMNGVNIRLVNFELKDIERKAVEKMVEGLLVDIKKEVPEIPVVYVD